MNFSLLVPNRKWLGYLQASLAGTCRCLAKALLKQNKKLEEALSLARRTVEIYTRLRVPGKIQSAQETLGEIEARVKGE